MRARNFTSEEIYVDYTSERARVWPYDKKSVAKSLCNWKNINNFLVFGKYIHQEREANKMFSKRQKNIKSNLIERSVGLSIALRFASQVSAIATKTATNWLKWKKWKKNNMNEEQTSRLHYLPIYLTTKRHKMLTHEITTTINPPEQNRV